MRIILNEGEKNEKIYVQARVKAVFFRRALDLLEKTDLNQISTAMLDNMMQFVCDVFQNQFDLQDIYAGKYGDELVPLFEETLAFVIGAEENEQAKKKMLAD